MTNNSKTPFKIIKTLTYLYLAFLISLIWFSTVAYIIISNHTLDFENLDILFLTVALSLCLFGIVGGEFIKKNVLNSAKTKHSLYEKLSVYQSATLIRYATIEVPALFTIVSYFLTEQFIFLIITMLLILYFFSLKPNKTKIAKELNLNRELQMEFDKENKELN